MQTGKRDIQSLEVRCDNDQEGCQWIGELLSLENHFKNCGYTKIPCPNGCHSASKRKRSRSDVLRSLAATTFVYRKDLQKHLEEECPCRQHTCPHCLLLGEYKNITGDHLKICPKFIILCKHLQCKETFPRDQLDMHNSVCKYVRVPCKYSSIGCKAKPLRKDLKVHKMNDGVHAHFTIDAVLLMKRDIEQLKNSNEQLQQDCRELREENTQLTTQLRTFSKKAPCLSFSVKDFTSKKESDEEFFSPPFLTHHKGYRLTICVDLNGDGEEYGTHVSVWAYLMRGKYDDQLDFPFRGTITFELLNQLENSNHHCRSYTYKDTEGGVMDRVMDHERADRAHGVFDFITHTSLYYNTDTNCQYLKDDSLVFRIYVEMPCYKSWLESTPETARAKKR